MLGERPCPPERRMGKPQGRPRGSNMRRSTLKPKPMRSSLVPRLRCQRGDISHAYRNHAVMVSEASSWGIRRLRIFELYRNRPCMRRRAISRGDWRAHTPAGVEVYPFNLKVVRDPGFRQSVKIQQKMADGRVVPPEPWNGGSTLHESGELSADVLKFTSPTPSQNVTEKAQRILMTGPTAVSSVTQESLVAAPSPRLIRSFDFVMEQGRNIGGRVARM
jgi:hypothetical protein